MDSVHNISALMMVVSIRWKKTCPGVCIATSAICTNKHLHPPLRQFVGHILNKVKPAFKVYHGFVDGNLTTKIVCSLEIVKQWIHNWPQLVEWVIAVLLSLKWRK